MNTVNLWLTAIRDAINQFIDIVKSIQRIADSMAITTGKVPGRRSFGNKKRMIKGNLPSSFIDPYEYDWVRTGSATLIEGAEGTWQFPHDAPLFAEWIIPLRSNERVRIKFVPTTDSEGIWFNCVAYNDSAPIHQYETGGVTSSPDEQLIVYTSSGDNDWLAFRVDKISEGQLVFKLVVEVQVVVQTVQNEDESGFHIEQFTFDVPLETIVPRYGSFFYDGEGWQVNGVSEVRSGEYIVIMDETVRPKFTDINIYTDALGNLDCYVRYLRNNVVVSELGFRLRNGPMSWAQTRPLRSLPNDEPNPSGTPPVLAALSVPKGDGYLYTVQVSNDILLPGNDQYLNQINGIELIFSGFSGSVQRITGLFFTVRMTSEPYTILEV